MRYDRTYDGLPVIGGDLVLHENPDGSAQSVNWATRDRISVLSTAASRSTVPKHSLAGSAKKVVFAAMHEPVLAWESRVTGTESDGTPIDELLYTDARTGKRLGVRQNIFTEGTGHSLYSGTVPVGSTATPGGFSMTDPARGGHKTYDATGITDEFDPARGSLVTDTDNTWGDGAPANSKAPRSMLTTAPPRPGTSTRLSSLATGSRTTVWPPTPGCTSGAATTTPSGTTPASA